MEMEQNNSRSDFDKQMDDKSSRAPSSSRQTMQRSHNDLGVIKEEDEMRPDFKEELHRATSNLQQFMNDIHEEDQE